MQQLGIMPDDKANPQRLVLYDYIYDIFEVDNRLVGGGVRVTGRGGCGRKRAT